MKLELSLAVLCLTALMSTDAQAEVIQVFSFSELNSHHSTVSIGLPGLTDGQVVSSPHVEVIPGINTITYSVPSGSFQVLSLTQFQPFQTGALSNMGNGPITIDFMSPVNAVGFQLHSVSGGILSIHAFNGATLLGTFTVSGETTLLGLVTTGDDAITRLVVSGAVPSSSFAVGATGLHNAPEPVPEPATLLLMGTGLAGVWAGSRRRRIRGGEDERTSTVQIVATSAVVRGMKS